MRIAQENLQFVICIDNAAYPAALERRKIYQVVPDATAATHQLVRIIDESGEDYVYPAQYFLPVTFPPHIQEAILHAA